MNRTIRVGVLSILSFSLIHCEVTEMIGACFRPSSIDVVGIYDDRVLYEIHDEDYGFDSNEPLFLEEYRGSLYFEGDIVFGDLDELFSLDPNGNIRHHPTCGSTSLSPMLWPSGEIPYLLPDDLKPTDLHNIMEALTAWNESSHINFRPREPSDRDFVTFVYHYTDNGRCSSYLGRKGGRQEIRMAHSGCGLRLMIHELGHAIGLAHEHSRCDRDDHIEVYWDNISSYLHHNFRKSCRVDRIFGDYDPESIMHYHGTAFSNNGQPTLGRTQGGSISLNTKISEGDVATVNHLVDLSLSDGAN